MKLGQRSIIGWPAGKSVDSHDTSILSGVRSMNEVFPSERTARGK